MSRRILTLLMAAVVVGATSQPASANSTTGIAEYTYEQCFGGVPTATQIQDFATGLLGLSDPRCRDIAVGQTTHHVGEETQTAGSAVALAEAAPDAISPGLAGASAAVGEGIAQAAELLGLPILTNSWSASEGVIWAAVLTGEHKVSVATGQAADDVVSWVDTVVSRTQADPLHCVWVPSPCMFPTNLYTTASSGARDQMGYDDYSNFIWNNDIEMWWDEYGNGKKMVKGGAYSNLYRASRQPNAAWRFWATTQAHSMTPVNNWKLKRMEGTITSQQLQRVEFSPLNSSKHGNAGTISIQAGLSGESTAGFAASVGRSWSISDGIGGGGMIRSGHFTFYEATGKGTKWTQSAEGGETWKIPPDDTFEWFYKISGSFQK